MLQLKGPFEVGNALVGKNNMIQVMLEMANSDEPIRQVKLNCFSKWLFKI